MSVMVTETTDQKTAEIQWTKCPNWDCPRCQSVNAGHREICRICGLDSALLSGGCYFRKDADQEVKRG